MYSIDQPVFQDTKSVIFRCYKTNDSSVFSIARDKKSLIKAETPVQQRLHPEQTARTNQQEYVTQHSLSSNQHMILESDTKFTRSTKLFTIFEKGNLSFTCLSR